MTTSRRVVPGVLGAWLLLALGIGGSGLLATLLPPWPQVMLVSLTAVTLLALYRVPPVRVWADRADVRWFVAFHLTRFVGFYFLVLYGRGELPYDFAVPGGWGDIIVAAAAIPLLLLGPLTPRRRPLYAVWNVVGLLDILFVVATATRLGLADPASLAPLLRLPLSLLITFIVPVVIATHLWLFRRIRGATDGGSAG